MNATEIEVGGRTFVIGKIPAFKQLHVFRRIMPVMKAAVTLIRSRGEIDATDVLMGMTDVLATLPDDHLDYVIHECLAVAAVKESGRTMPLMRGGTLMYQDLDMIVILQVAWNTIMENFGPFLSGLLAGPLNGEGATPPTT